MNIFLFFTFSFHLFFCRLSRKLVINLMQSDDIFKLCWQNILSCFLWYAWDSLQILVSLRFGDFLLLCEQFRQRKNYRRTALMSPPIILDFPNCTFFPLKIVDKIFRAKHRSSPRRDFQWNEYFSFYAKTKQKNIFFALKFFASFAPATVKSIFLIRFRFSFCFITKNAET